MPDDRPYIEIRFTGTALTQYTLNTLIGTNIVIDYGDGNTVNYTGDYSHTYNTSGTYTIRIYGVTSLGFNCFRNCTGLTSIVIPDGGVTSLETNCFYNCIDLTSVVISNSVTSLGKNCFRYCESLTSVVIPDSIISIRDYCFAGCTDLVDIQLNWTSSTDIITYNSSWIEDTNDDVVFIIPQGTTSLYSAKGYPSEKLVERTSNVSSHELFSDVTSLLLNGSEVESIVVDDIDGLVLYQKPHTSILLTATNNTISYGETITLNGTLDGVNNGTIKLYQNDTLIDTLNISSNGSFTKTFNNLNAGTYTYKAVYDGDNTHYDGQSNEVIITVNKATPVLTLSSDISVIHYNERVVLSGTTTIDGTIKIYQTGEATPLSSVESNNGTFTYNFINRGQDNIQIYANIESTSNYNQASSNIVTLTYNSKYFTNLAIEVPALVYSDVFNITGILTDENSDGIGGANVKLIRDGNILEATDTTDLNGEVTFHCSEPTSITTYAFQLVFDGDSSYSNSSSSVVSRTVGKETSVLNIASPNNNSSITQGNDLTITGNLSDNDATPMTGKTVIVKARRVLNLTANKNILSYYDEDEAVLTATYTANDNAGKRVTFSGAEFDTTMTNGMDLTFGNEATISNIEMTQDGSSIYIGNPNDLLLIQHLGEDSYGLARVQDNFPTRIDYIDISLGFSYNENTLYYYDNNGIFATYDITGLAKRIVSSSTSFSVVSSAIGVLTDSNGVATVSYTSQGVGDVTITAECDNVTDTLKIEDYVDLISSETDQLSKFGSSISLRNSGTSSISYDSTNKQYVVNITKANSESFIPMNSATGLDDVIIEFDGIVVSSSNSFVALCFYKENSNWGRLGTRQVDSSTAYEYATNTNGTYAEADISGSTPPSNTWLHYKFIITNDTVHRQVYNGETLIYEDTRTYTGFFTSNTKYGFTALWSTVWKGYYKNIKIKPLVRE